MTKLLFFLYCRYCPLGQNNMPFGGFVDSESPHSDSESPHMLWAPIRDVFNDWVHVSKMEGNYCKTYMSLYLESPTWGMSGMGNEEITRSIMCCVSPEGEADVSVAGNDGSVQIPGSQESPISNELKAISSMLYSRMDHNLQPTAHDRMSGWTGHVYSAAKEYCSSEESKVPCTLDALCPNGIGDSDYLDLDGGPVWASVDDDAHPWVEIRGNGHCVKQPDLPKVPDVMRYVFCCKGAGGVLNGEDSGNRPFQLVPASMPAAEAMQQQQPKPASSAVTPSSVKVGAEGSVLSGEEVKSMYQEVEDKFQIVSFNRSEGWAGHTYGEALEFCARKSSKIPCPYEAICPMGPNGLPIGEVEDGWVPIMDSANGWVQTGHKNTCMKYTDMKPHPPLWGITGKENEAITRRIKCCDELEGIGTFQDEHPKIDQITETEEGIMTTMHPIWFGRKDGYHGTTHEEAELFCRTIAKMHLCPVEAYCPNGPRQSKVLYLQKDAFEGEQWAPVSKYNNEDTGIGSNWIMVGMKDGDPLSTCSQYEQLNDFKSPPWTADGSQPDLKEHVLCCSEQEAMNHEHVIARAMNSIWLDDSHGWNGGSYDDAVQFCHDLGGKRLCPYPAYCPQGPGMQPMGGHTAIFNSEDEQWAPVYGEPNYWVQIGRKYGNSATTCLSHKQLEGSNPEWGLSNDNASAKRHIQCCSF
mmetsp:Transcript_27007/g.57005  ORF Transcript_27007/g.57005 Transcript_27007/m.57005 type:complete len:693 (+) Transcript_27007:57-2135(+)